MNNQATRIRNRSDGSRDHVNPTTRFRKRILGTTLDIDRIYGTAEKHLKWGYEMGKRADAEFRNGDIARAEISRQLQKNEYARAEKLLDQILRVHPDHLSAHALCINLYSKTGRIIEARALFDRAKKPAHCHVLYDAMIEAYGTQEPVKAREIFDLAVKNGQTDFTTYGHMAHVYYNLEQFRQLESVLKNSPPELGRTPTILMLAEALRKLDKPDEALKLAEHFITYWGSKSYTDDSYIRARVIRAFCFLKIDKRMADAQTEFGALKMKTPRTSIHYARILCGYVFSNETLPQSETEHVKQVLNHMLTVSERNLKGDIERALQKLERMDSAAALGQPANGANTTRPEVQAPPFP